MARGIRIVGVAGTRPEAIKFAPILIEARLRRGLHPALLATGQQDAMFDDALAEFGLTPDIRLPPHDPDPDPDVLLGRLSDALLPVLRRRRPDLVLVQGDTTSAYAGALAASAAGVPVAHIEAGLRSGDLSSPWPEERNRVAIDALATLLFAPTDRAVANLATDPAVRGVVHHTGNSGVDALLWMRARSPRRPVQPGHHLILLTCHRRESFGAGITNICVAALRLAERGDVQILCPVHTNPQVETPIRTMLGDHPAITLTGPLSYRDTVHLMGSARLILTDSGGIQEEAPVLGTPALVLRAVTERQEGVASGNLALVGTDPDRIVAAATRLLDDEAAHAAMAHIAFPFGRGGAAAKILDHIEQYFSAEAQTRAPLLSTAFWTKDGAPKGV